MIEILQSKIHRATVSDANLNYEGSITIPVDLMEFTGLREFQKVLIVNINNANRFETYVIKTTKTNYICLNGACARLASVGDRIIIMAFEYVNGVSEDYKPCIIMLDDNNEVIKGE
jgi:aspartate 1-decarboxylase